MLRNFDINHLQIRKRVLQDSGFFITKIAARFFLNHRQLVDKHFRELEIDFAFAGFRIWNLAQKKRGVLRVHHDKLDEALGKLAALGCLHFFAGHIYFCFAAAAPAGGRTVAKT